MNTRYSNARRPLSRLALSGSAVAFAAALMAASPALAQDAPAPAEAAQEEEGEEIVITGFRAALETAINTKRNADTIIESVSTEDLGRLPDTSIADAISRLPGIASQRTDGQSSALNIRGLSQQLTFSTLNGREQVSPNGNRTVEFDQYPSELLAGADVYKSPKASLIEGGIGGTVELKTVRPLDKKKAELLVNVRAQYNDRANEILDADEFGYRANISYIDQFADGTIGIALGYSRLSQADVSTRFVGFDYASASRDLSGDGVADAVSFGFEVEQQGGKNVRDGAFGTLQWRPSDKFEWTTDVFYSHFETNSYGRGLRVTGPQQLNETPQTTLGTNLVFANNALIGGTLTRNAVAPTAPGGGAFGLTIIGINDNQNDENSLFTVGNKATFTGERVKASLDFTYSRSDSTFANQVSAVARLAATTGGTGGTGIIATDQQVTYRLRGTDLPTVSFAQDYTNRATNYLTSLGLYPYDNDDELIAIAGNVKYDAEWGPISSIELGARYATRDASQYRESIAFGNDAGYFQFAENALAPIALTPANSVVQCFKGDFAAAGFPCFLAVRDPLALVTAQVGPVTTNQNQGFTRSESFTVNEDVLAGYIQANIKTELFGAPLSGNIGLRVVQTDQGSVNLAVPAFSRSVSYTEWLPSLNLNFALSDRDNLRFAASRALSRPPLTQLGGGVNVSWSPGEGRLTGGGNGNPSLRPFLANQIDLSYEHYFSNNGIFTVAAFYKDLESFIVRQSINNYDYSAAGLTDLLSVTDRALWQTAGSNPIGRYDGPVNGQGGYVYGFEIAGTYTFDFLPGALRGLGATASYSYTNSEIGVTNALSGRPQTISLPGLSDHVVNASLFWELGGFATRGSARYRSSFVSPQTGINEQLPLTAPEFVVDFQASYKFPDTSPLKGLTILFQANNLTDEPVTTYFGNVPQTGTIQYFGREFFLGASFAF